MTERMDAELNLVKLSESALELKNPNQDIRGLKGSTTTGRR